MRRNHLLDSADVDADVDFVDGRVELRQLGLRADLDVVEGLKEEHSVLVSSKSISGLLIFRTVSNTKVIWALILTLTRQ